jgi:hypothetical protein
MSGIASLLKYLKKPSEYQEGNDITEKMINKLPYDPRVGNKGLQDLKYMVGAPPADLEAGHATLAYVDPRENPHQVNVMEPQANAYWKKPNKALVAHELEHTVSPQKRHDLLAKNYAILHGEDPNAKDFDLDKWHKKSTDVLMMNAASNPDLYSHMATKYEAPIYIGKNGLLPTRNRYEEIAADLGAAQRLSKTNMYADPYLQKNLFNNDPRLMEAVASTLRTEPQMDPRDLAPFTAYPQNVNTYQNLIKQNQILESREAAKNMKTGGFIDKPIKGGKKDI